MSSNLKKWMKYFNHYLKKEYSLEQVKYNLKQLWYDGGFIDNIVKYYSKRKYRNKQIAIASSIFFIVILITSFLFFTRPVITGMSVLTLAEPKTYYVSNSGSDSNNGLSEALPIKTIAKVNTLNLQPGDSILFKRGNMWRFPTDAYLSVKSGSSSGYIKYGAYGSGEKPLFLGSYNASSTGNWTNGGNGNIWNTTFTNILEMGLVVINDDIVGGKITSTYAGLNVQGEFYYNPATDKLSMYSTSNPANYYGNIEVGIEKDMINYDTKDYLIFENMAFKYGARHGIDGRDVNHIIIRNNSFSFGGGAYQSGTIRYGDAIELWDEANDVIIEYNDVYAWFEAGISPQGYGDNKILQNIIIRNNLISNGEMCFAFFSRGSNSPSYNITIDHNTCYNNTPTIMENVLTYGHGIYFGNVDNSVNMIITNNIFQFPDNKIYITSNHVAGVNLSFDYNLYYDAVGNMLTYDGTSYTQAQFATYQSAESQDAHSQIGKVLFVDVINKDFTPASDSPACTMSSTGSYVGALPCVGQEESYCGDLTCNEDENCSTCSEDCGACPVEEYCGDDICNANESCSSCAEDCGICPPFCGDANCDEDENCSTCESDCGECPIIEYCGDDVCNNNENCSSCPLDCGICPNTTISSCILENKTWNEDEYILNAHNLSECFNDPLNSSLEFSSHGDDEIIISIEDGLVTLSSIEDWNGAENVYFKATGSGGRTATTNTVELIVLPISDCGDDVCNLDENCSLCSADCGECPPVYPTITVCDLENKTWNEDESLNDVYDLNQCFNDPNENPINYITHGNDSIVVSIEDGIVSLSSPTDWNGAEYISFTGYGTGNRTATTNNIKLTVIAMPDCNDGLCEGNENCSTCSTDCGTCPIEGYCGDSIVQDLLEEVCETPNTQNNNYCSQSASQCLEKKLGTRDSYGYCDNDCGCIDDNFVYSCVKDQCSAECSTDSDCDDGNPITTDTCLNNCSCQNTGDNDLDDVPDNLDCNDNNYLISTCSGCNICSEDYSLSNNDGECIPATNESNVNYEGCPIPKYTKFNNSITTDFTNISLIDASDVTIAIENIGLIEFSVNVSLVTQLGNGNYSSLDLDSYIEISPRSISLDSVNLPELNVSSRLTFYSLGFTSYTLLKDGTETTSYSINTVPLDSNNYTLKVNVPSFTTYEVIQKSTETENTPGTSGSSGGGGGGSGSLGKTFQLNKEWKTETLKVNEKLLFDYKKEKHHLFVDKINPDSVDISVYSKRIPINLKIGKWTSIDINEDNKKDIDLRYEGVENNEAIVGLRESEQVITRKEENKQEDIVKTKEEEKTVEGAIEPEEESIEQPSTEKKGIEIKNFGIILGLIVLMPIIYIVLLKSSGGIRKKIGRTLYVNKINRIVGKKSDGLEGLRSYIKKCQRKYTKEEIIKACTEIGWKKELVEQLVEK